MKKIIIIATEPSGDYLGYKLISSLKKENKEIQFFGIGGEQMTKLGLKSIIPISKLSVNGYYEVFLKIFSLLYFLKKTINYIKMIKPDILITIDSPSFNYRVVKKIQFLRGKTQFIHYVAPTVWAWKDYRAKQFSKVYDKILTLFSFENKYFEKYKLESHFVGHPIFYEKLNDIKISKKKIITFFPGSRLNEVKKILPRMLIIIKKLKKKYKFIELKILTISPLYNFINDATKNIDIEVVCDKNDKLYYMKGSSLAIAASGTVSLELAFFGIPMIIVYNTNFLTSLIINKFVKVKWACLINIIFNKDIIPEFLFKNYKAEMVFNKIEDLLVNKKNVNIQKNYFKKLPSVLLNKTYDPSFLASKIILGLKKST